MDNDTLTFVFTPDETRELYDALWQALYARRASAQRAREQGKWDNGEWPLVQKLITTIDFHWKDQANGY